jgi:hypothetical protein
MEELLNFINRTQKRRHFVSKRRSDLVSLIQSS